MPKFDKTGPAGQGPMTGRGMGSCEGGNQEGQTPVRGNGFGAGFGRGFGGRFGRGMCRWFGLGRRFAGQTEDSSDVKAYQKELKDELKATEEYLEKSEDKK